MSRLHTPAFLKKELVLLFFVLPAVLAILQPRGAIYYALWLVSGLALFVMKREGYSLRADWNAGGLKQHLPFILKRFLPFAIALLLFAWVMIPERLFSLPLERPTVWMAVMVFYPILSALPQEFVFRSYFFWRFSKLLAPTHLIIASALAFGWVHIVLQNWVAVVFSAVGGLLFADTYRRTKSLSAVFFEHALYGCFIFTIGMGFYFYHGHAVR